MPLPLILFAYTTRMFFLKQFPLNHGEIFGLYYSTISQNRSRLRRIFEKHKQVQAHFEEIDRRIGNLSKRKI